jgi:HPt (histidine-containing phosphotransfer) domain-containing protein
MNDHIAKPVDPLVLYAVIAKWLGTRVPVTSISSAVTLAEAAESAIDAASVAEPAALDLNTLAMMTGGKEGTTRRVLLHFIDHHEKDAEQLNDRLAAADCKVAFQIAHAIKGSSGQIGATALHVAAGAIEAPLRIGQHPAVEDIQAFAVLLSRVLEQICAWIRDHPEPAAKAAINPPQFLARLRELLALVDATDGRALIVADEVACELPDSLGAVERSNISAGLDAVRRVDFEDASRSLKSILTHLETMA